jgi:hypothetical protein
MMTTAQQQALINYLGQADFGLPRFVDPEIYFITGAPHQQPPVKELVEFFLNDAKFQALKLGTFLGTPDGKLFTAAVEAVVPPFYAADVNLIVDALTAAARAQTHLARVRAFVVGGFGTALLVGAIWSDKKAA